MHDEAVARFRTFGCLVLLLGACASVLLSSCAAGSPLEAAAPQESTVFVPRGKTYAVFHDVLLRHDGLLFFVPDHLEDTARDAAHTPPNLQRLLAWQHWTDLENFKVHVISRHNRSDYPDTCTNWIEQPTITYESIQWDHLNMYHFFMDNFLRMFATITDLGFFDIDKFLERTDFPTSRDANLILLQRNGHGWQSKFGDLFDHITPDQWTLPQAEGACFRTLVTGADGMMMTYTRATSQVDQERRTAAFGRFARFAIPAQLRTDKLRGRSLPQQALQGDSGRVQIKFISRPKGPNNSRAVLNEAEIVETLQERYGLHADVSLILFNYMTLSEAMVAMNYTDILIGVHGAGLTNALWLQPGSVIVQLIPYGWERSPGKVIGYEQLSKNVNCTHLMWRNMEAENAFFEPTYFEEHPDAYQMHPNELDVLAGAQYNELGQLHPHYLYQDTHVNIDSFLPVADEAMSILGYPKDMWNR